MDKAKPFYILWFVLTALLTLSTLLFFVDNQNLKKNYSSLLEESKKLRTSLETLEASNKEILDRVEKDKKSLKDSIEALKKENEALQFTMKKAKIQMDSAVEEKTYLEEMLINKTKEIDLLKTNPSATPSFEAVSGDAQDLVQKIRQKDEEIAKLGEQNKILSDKLTRLYQTTNEKISEINVAKIALEETVASARKKIEEEWNTVNLGSITVDKKGSSETIKEARKSPKKEGRVLAINEEHGFVVVDLGRVDNLNQEMTLAVNESGRPIATLSVLEIRDIMSACNIKELQEGQKIKVNDAVSIQT